MKLKMYELQLLANAIATMKQNRVKGMNRFLFEVTAVLDKDAKYFNQELKSIQEAHAEKDNNGELIRNEQDMVLLNGDGQKFFAELLQEDSSDYPTLTPEQGDLLEEYPLLYDEFALLLRMVKRKEE